MSCYVWALGMNELKITGETEVIVSRWLTWSLHVFFLDQLRVDGSISFSLFKWPRTYDDDYEFCRRLLTIWKDFYSSIILSINQSVSQSQIN